MKKTLLSLLLSSTIGFSQCWSSCDCTTPPLPYCSTGETGITIAADFLYWKAYADNLNFVSLLNSEDPFAPTGRFYEVDFKMDPGFRILAGYRIPCFHWDITGSYTRFHTSASNSVSIDDSGNQILVPLYSQIQGLSVISRNNGTASAKWKMDHDAFDIDFGRKFPLSAEVFLEPYFGVKGAWIDQTYNLLYTNVLIQTPAAPLPDQPITITNDFWGIGPKLGCSGIWEIWRYLSFYSNISAALLWGEFENRLVNAGNPSAGGIIGTSTTTFDKGRVRPALQAQLGMTLRIPFRQDRHWFFVTGAYEVQYYWGLQENFAFVVNFFPQGDLSMQGLTLRSGFDF